MLSLLESRVFPRNKNQFCLLVHPIILSHIDLCVYVHVCAHVHVCSSFPTFIYMCVHVYAYVCAFFPTLIYMCVCACVCTCVHVCVRTCMYDCMCMCVLHICSCILYSICSETIPKILLMNTICLRLHSWLILNRKVFRNITEGMKLRKVVFDH